MVPYLLFAIMTKARIEPVLKEALEMVILTNGAFEAICENRKQPRSREDDENDGDTDSDASDDPENYAKR